MRSEGLDVHHRLTLAKQGAAPVRGRRRSPEFSPGNSLKESGSRLRRLGLAGEQAQVDWAHFGHLEIGRACRPLMAFVKVLSYSRQIFLRFFADAWMENFLRGHVGAFTAWRSACPPL